MNDTAIRLKAFDWLGMQVPLNNGALPWSLLVRGFNYQSTRIPLVSMQGIFKPRVMELPLTIRTSLAGKYADDDSGDFIKYCYRGTNRLSYDNVWLRKVMKKKLPLIYLQAIAKGLYEAIWPVYIVNDNPDDLFFSVIADDYSLMETQQYSVSETDQIRRGYATVNAKRRIHQGKFRELVLAAYQTRCTICKIRHKVLLDAAHIVPDADEGRATVDNGLSLCKIHHAAYDNHILGITPDYKIEIREDILHEKDGPMLQHGLVDLHGRPIHEPRRPQDKPSKELLDKRYQEFRRAG